MTREEAEKYANNMTYRDAINNLMKARCIPYRKATFIKVNELLKALEQEPYDDAKYHEEHREVVVDKTVWEDAKRALEQEPAYCDRNICLKNEYNGIGCDECEVTKSQESNNYGDCGTCLNKYTDKCNNCVVAEHQGKRVSFPTNYKKQLSSGDAVSRQVVFDQIYEWMNTCEYRKVNATDYFVNRINKLPSVNPQPCEDAISRKSIKHKLQEHHDFFVNAYGGFSNLPQNDKARVDEILNCIAMVVNEPPVNPQPTGHWIMPQQDDGMSDPIYYQVRCSECGFNLDPQTWHQELHQYDADKFCPNCGCRMVEPQESEVNNG